MARALDEGRFVGIGPTTEQILRIRGLIKVGYRYDPNDLEPWQWEALVQIEQTIEEHKARELERASHRSSQVHH